MKTKLLLILLIFSLPILAQERAALQGRVTVADANAPNIFVINKNTGIEVKTDAQGLFTVAARHGDKLIVYSDKTVVREFYISPESFKNMPYVLEVEPKGYEIEEVVVTQLLGPEAFGLPKDQKQYTVAERRLKTAGEFKPTFTMILAAGLSFPLDPIINAITGRTKMLKKELATERKILGMENIGNIYTEEQMTSVLGIPAEKVQGFLYYAVEDAALSSAIKDNKIYRAELELTVLAGKYLALQQEEAAQADTQQPQQQQPAQPQPATNEN